MLAGWGFSFVEVAGVVEAQEYAKAFMDHGRTKAQQDGIPDGTAFLRRRNPVVLFRYRGHRRHGVSRRFLRQVAHRSRSQGQPLTPSANLPAANALRWVTPVLASPATDQAAYGQPSMAPAAGGSPAASSQQLRFVRGCRGRHGIRRARARRPSDMRNS